MKDMASVMLDKYEGRAAAPDVTIPKHTILSALQTGVYLVEFVKTNGELTQMEATLRPELLPQPKDTAATRAQQDHLIYAYSPDRGGWRSFVAANVRSITKKL